MKLALAALIGATALGVAASAQPAKSPPCFYTRDMNNHTVLDDHTMLVKVNNRDVWKIGMAGACLAGAFSTDPLIIRVPPGSSQVCRPIDLDLSISKGGIPARCIVTSLHKLTPAEVAAVPPKMRP